MWLACVGLSLALRQERGGEEEEGRRGLDVWPLNDLPAWSDGPFCHARQTETCTHPNQHTSQLGDQIVHEANTVTYPTVRRRTDVATEF